MEISFQISDVKKLDKNFKLMETGFLNAVEKAVLASVKIVEGDAKQNVAKSTGHLARTITSGLTEKTKDNVAGIVGCNAPYAAAIEFGRPPSRNSSGTPLYKRRSFILWVKNTLGDENLAFVVARAIHRKGFKAKPFMLPAVQKNMEKIRSLINQGLKQTLSTFKEEEE